MIRVHPSPAIIVRADTPISECIRRMNELGVGSVLVVRDALPGDLIGIFTERDLLTGFEQLRKGDYWDKPVRAVMRHPVQTIGVDELDQAGERMIAGGFRHLPVVIEGKDGGMPQLAGMVSMRDVLRNLLGTGQPEAHRPKVAVYTRQPSVWKLIKGMPGIQAAKLSLRDRQRADLPGYECVILDLDFRQPRDWAEFVLEAGKTRGFPPLIVIFDPILHDARVETILRRLESNPRVQVFTKPVNVIELLQSVLTVSEATRG